jgi:hypothetical protein
MATPSAPVKLIATTPADLLSGVTHITIELLALHASPKACPTLQRRLDSISCHEPRHVTTVPPFNGPRLGRMVMKVMLLEWKPH